jgi:transposase
MYLQSDERAIGLIHLLSIGLRILTLIEYQARKHLADLNEKLSGLYAGNPKRATDHPTAEALLQAFKGIYLSVVTIGEQVLYHMTPLSDVQGKSYPWWTSRHMSMPNWLIISRNRLQNRPSHEY